MIWGSCISFWDGFYDCPEMFEAFVSGCSYLHFVGFFLIDRFTLRICCCSLGLDGVLGLV